MYRNLFLRYSFKRRLQRVMLRSAQSQRCTFPESRPCPGLHQRAQSLIPVQDVHRPGPEGLMAGGYFPFLLIPSPPEYDGDDECHHAPFSSAKSSRSTHSLTVTPLTPLIWTHAARTVTVCVRLCSLPGVTAQGSGAGQPRSLVRAPSAQRSPLGYPTRKHPQGSRKLRSRQQTAWGMSPGGVNGLPSAAQLCRKHRQSPTRVTSGAATPL